jgi:GntR family transcriptional regulator, transcriptional repressor for pyruvate dehydrogenase complex
MEKLQVSRSTIREALNGLAVIGAIEIRHGQGAFVAENLARIEARESLTAALAKGVTQDLVEARRAVETQICRLAAVRRTEADLHEMEEQLELCERAVAEGRPAAAPGVDLHLAIAQSAHNEVLFGFMASIAHLLVERGPALEGIHGYKDWELADHRRLYEAVALGDPDLAAERIEAHLDEVVRYYRQLDRRIEASG